MTANGFDLGAALDLFDELAKGGLLLSGVVLGKRVVFARSMATDQADADRAGIVSCNMGAGRLFWAARSHRPIPVDDPMIPDG